MEKAMDLLVEDRDETNWKIPPGVPTYESSRSEPDELVFHDGETPTYLHPAVLVVVTSGYAWFLLVSWVVFFGHGYMGITLVVATMISALMAGMMAVAGGRNVTPWQRPWRSFREFLAGDVEVWGGRVPGRDAFAQLAGMAFCLAALATAFGIIVEASRP
jgi:hypothetical protein